MSSLVRLILPFCLALPVAALAQDPAETIEVIGTSPKAARPGRPMLAPNPSKLTLHSKVFHFPSGLRVLMQSDRTHPIVSVLMIVDHGAGDDPQGKNGTAHFVEHTWFRSIHGDLPPIMTLIQDLGTQFNATTRPDTTDYRTVASSEFLPLLLRLESRRLVEPYVGMTEDQVEVEREVVRNEWRRRNEQSSSLVFDYLLKSIFPEGHPYHGRETNESLDAIDLKTLTDYFDKHYTPDKTTIIVVGDFELDDSINLILANFEPQVLHPDLKPEHIRRFPKPGIESPNPDDPTHWAYTAVDPRNPDNPFPLITGFPPRVSPKPDPLPAAPSRDVQYYKAAVDNRTVLVGWALPGGFRGNDTEMAILANAASGTIGNSLFSRGLLDTDDKKRGLKGPGCFPVPMKVHSVIACAVEITDQKRYPDPRRVADLLMDQLAPLWNPEMVQLQQRFFGQAKNDEIARVLRSVDDVAFHFGGRAEDIGFHFHNTGSGEYHSDRIREVKRIDFKAVADLGYQYLKRDRAAVAVVDPIPAKDIDKSASTSSYRGANETDTVAASDNAITRMTAAEIESSYVRPNLSGLVDKKLKNGLRVVIVPFSENPLVEATLVIGGGTAMQPKGMFNFLGTFTTNSWDRTSTSMGNDPLMIAGSRTQNGSSVNWSTGVRAPNGNLDGALWFLREEMETTTADMAYRSTYVKKQRDRYLGGLHSRGFHSSDLSRRHLYPDSPDYWPSQWKDIQAMGTWKASIVNQTLADMLQPTNATLLIVGNVDADDALRLAVDYFAGWEPRPEAKIGTWERPVAGPPGNEAKVLVFDDPKRTQTQVTRTCRLNTTGVADLQAAQVLSNLVFDQVFSNLRVKEGLAYSPGGFAGVSPDGAGSLTYSSLAVNVGVGRTVEYFRDLTGDLESGRVDDAMLNTYKVRRARSFGVEAQSTSQLTGRLSSAVSWQQPWSMLLDAGTHIADVDAARIQSLVAGCNDRSITVLEGPAEVIEPQLKEKGIAYEIVDWKARGEQLHQAADPKSFAKRQKAQAKAEAKKAAEAAPPPAEGDPEPDPGAPAE
jgi:zinc protease